MALRIRPIAARLGKLSIGISQTSVRRLNQTAAISTTTTNPAGAGPTQTQQNPPPPPPPLQLDAKAQAKEAAREEKRRKKREKQEVRAKEKVASSFAPGYGEKIYIFSHFLEGLTVYSHDPVLRATSALRQLPFNGKKMKPSKLRKDYWRAVAMVQFPEGFGDVGRSVYARLRECKRLHETAWDDSVLYDVNTKRTLRRLERGRALNDQRGNAIADVAAVLGGLGKGNKMWVDLTTVVEEEVVEEVEEVKEVAAEESAAGAGEGAAAAGEESAAAEEEGAVAKEGAVIVEAAASEKIREGTIGVPEADMVKIRTEGGEVKGLMKTTIWWANELDRNFAKEWPANVTHQLFAEADLEPLSVGGRGPPKPEEDEGEDERGETSQKAPEELVAEQGLSQGNERHKSSF